MPAREGGRGPEPEADVEIGAAVTAKRLLFRRKPRAEANARGEARTPEGRADAVAASGSERRNLPDQVEPGVPYRDVRVRWRAAARIADPARERGGEGERNPDPDPDR